MTVRTLRRRYAAISFQESSRPTGAVGSRSGPGLAPVEIVHLLPPFIVSASAIRRQDATFDATAVIDALRRLLRAALWQSSLQEETCTTSATHPAGIREG